VIHPQTVEKEYLFTIHKTNFFTETINLKFKGGFNMRLKATILSIAFLFFASTGLVMAERQDFPGAVYTMTNSDQGNEVLVFSRSADGSLTPDGAFATDGLGTGGGLGNQGGLILSQGNRWLFVVNAGSDTISVFKVKPNNLLFIGSFDSGGARPISLTVDRNLLYVLNAGGSVGEEDNISGFIVERDGMLSPLVGSTQPLSQPDTGPAQIEFTPDGNVLVVTEKATNRIDTYVVGNNGLAGAPIVFDSEGNTPFGFAFGKRNRLFVSEAAGGAAGASSVSSYMVFPDGDLEVISAAVPTTETAACWLVVTKNGRYAYTTNTGSGSVSGYGINKDGSIFLLDPDGQTGITGPGPIDMALSNNSRFLYTLNSGNGTISGFQVKSSGQLIPLSIPIQATGLPAGVNGLAAR
jgi:DNA-binding beta-propeller fold protein YncE